MKLTQILYKQHIQRYFKFHWKIQGKKTPRNTTAFKALADRNIPVYTPEEIFGEDEKAPKPVINDLGGLLPQPLKFDSSHPLWKDRICYTYKDNNVLVEGLNQAKYVTKTVEIQEGLPDNVELKKLPKGFDSRVKNIIFNSMLFDAEQVKLPKVKDPLRPAWNFPRTYGISEQRRSKLLISKLLQLIEISNENDLTKDRMIVNDVNFSFPFEKAGYLFQFALRGDTMITSSKPLQPVLKPTKIDIKLPDLYPLKEVISFTTENIYEIQNLYPLTKSASKPHPHTLFTHYWPTEVSNIYEEEVTNTQILGRSLLKAFAAAASYAKQQFGEEVKQLPNPVTVQCVHSNGVWFHFGILQLNTLDFDSNDEVKNVWYQTGFIPLFESCSYQLGKPVLEGYNNDVMKHLVAFYNNK